MNLLEDAFKKLRRWTVIAALFLCASSVYAHNPGLSGVTLKIKPGQTEAEIGFAVLDIAAAFPFDKNSDETVSKEEMAMTFKQLETMGMEELEISFDQTRVKAQKAKARIEDNNFIIDLIFTNGPVSTVKVEAKLLHHFAPEHQQFLSVREIRGTNEIVLGETLLTRSHSQFECSRNSAGEKKVESHTFSQFLLLGTKHILIGYDHLLFLFALLIMCESFASIVKIITCFTLAHSITLALATLNIVQMPGRVVEPLIAATIIYVGIENLFQLKTLRWRWLLTFVFGLVHGFGFASVLREMGISSGKSGIIMPLVSFNLGVELGQILIASIFLPILWRLRRNPEFIPRWVQASSVAVIIAGGYWLVERLWANLS